MNTPAIKLLCIADIHLGRRPSGLPDDLGDYVDIDHLSSSRAWALAVDEAIKLGVDAVLLAGDVVDHDAVFFMAYRALSDGVRKLAERGISVVGVAGNHDVKILPKLAAEMPKDFHLLGSEGTWSSYDVRGHNGSAVRVVGWSFQSAHHRKSPFDTPVPPRDGLPVVGLLHCDRDGPSSSPYAPVSSGELANANVDTWILGHIHRPDSLATCPGGGYVGSLVALDRSETGEHGPWLLEVESGGAMTFRQVPLAPLRWEVLDVSLDDLPEPEHVDTRIKHAAETLVAEIEKSPYLPRALGCRLHLSGRTPHRAAIEEHLRKAESDLVLLHEPVTVFRHKEWDSTAQPLIDLDRQAQGNDPAAILARYVLLLRGAPSDARSAFIADAHTSIRQQMNALGFDDSDAEPLEDHQIAAALEQAGLHVLDHFEIVKESAT